MTWFIVLKDNQRFESGAKRKLVISSIKFDECFVLSEEKEARLSWKKKGEFDLLNFLSRRRKIMLRW